MLEQPRNVKVMDVELNWARLDTPVSPFGTAQWELQIATTDKKKVKELKDLGLNVKEKDGKSVVSLKRKAIKSDGSPMDPVRVVDGARNPIENRRSIGNGSIGNVIIWQYPYDVMGRKGVGASLTAVQVTKLEEYTPEGSSNDFDIVENSESADLF